MLRMVHESKHALIMCCGSRGRKAVIPTRGASTSSITSTSVAHGAGEHVPEHPSAAHLFEHITCPLTPLGGRRSAVRILQLFLRDIGPVRGRWFGIRYFMVGGPADSF